MVVGEGKTGGHCLRREWVQAQASTSSSVTVHYMGVCYIVALIVANAQSVPIILTNLPQRLQNKVSEYSLLYMHAAHLCFNDVGILCDPEVINRGTIAVMGCVDTRRL